MTKIWVRYSITEILVTSINYGLNFEELESALMSEALFDFDNHLDIGFGLILLNQYYGKEIRDEIRDNR